MSNGTDDDDSENDSDYNPDNDPDRDLEDHDDNVKQLDDVMNFSRKRKVDSLWESMVEEDRQSTSTKMGNVNRMVATGVNSLKLGAQKKEKKLKKNQDLLASIFGKSDAKKIVKKAIASPQFEEVPMNNEDIKKVIEESVKKVQKKTKIVEVRKFAGREIRYEIENYLFFFQS